MALMKGITCCGDCVYYSKKKHKCTIGASKEENPRNPFYEDCSLPDVAPVVHGRWIDPPEAYGISLKVMPDDTVCSICHARFNVFDNCTELFKYCPKCGARMDGVSDV